IIALNDGDQRGVTAGKRLGCPARPEIWALGRVGVEQRVLLAGQPRIEVDDALDARNPRVAGNGAGEVDERIELWWGGDRPGGGDSEQQGRRGAGLELACQKIDRLPRGAIGR